MHHSLIKVQVVAHLVECLPSIRKALSSIPRQHEVDMVTHIWNPQNGMFRQEDKKFKVMHDLRGSSWPVWAP